MLKNKIKNKKNLLVLIIISVFVIVVTGALFLCYALINNYVVYDNIDSSSQDKNTTKASGAKKIIINNILLGGINEDKYIDANLVYDAMNKTKISTVDLFDKTNSYGTYDTSKFMKYNDVVFTKIAKDSVPTDYVAVEHVDKETKTKMGVIATKETATKEDIKYVKDALKGYRWYNPTINITEVYNVKIKENSDKIICVVSNSKNKLTIGAFSAVIYVTGNNARLVKYAYVKDTKNAGMWPVYSFISAIDINTDGVSEIILQETTQYYNTYSLLKLKEDGKFYQMLKVSTEI